MPMPSAWWTILAAAAAVSVPDGASWYLILAGNGARIGHSAQRTVATADGRELIDDREIRLQEAGDPATTITDHDVVRQDAQGRTVAISHYSQSGTNWTRVEAQITNGRAEIVRQTNSDRRTTIVALPPGVRFDGGAALIAAWDPARTAPLAFDNFSLDAMGVEHVVDRPGARDRRIRRAASSCCAPASTAGNCARWRGSGWTGRTASSKSSSRCSAPARRSGRRIARRRSAPIRLIVPCPAP